MQPPGVLASRHVRPARSKVARKLSHCVPASVCRHRRWRQPTAMQQPAQTGPPRRSRCGGGSVIGHLRRDAEECQRLHALTHRVLSHSTQRALVRAVQRILARHRSACRSRSSGNGSHQGVWGARGLRRVLIIAHLETREVQHGAVSSRELRHTLVKPHRIA